MSRYDQWSREYGVPLQYLIIDLTPVQFVDSMGLHLLEDLVFWSRKKGITLYFANPQQSVARDWQRVSLPELIGRENLWVAVTDAVEHARAQMNIKGVDIQPQSMTLQAARHMRM